MRTVSGITIFAGHYGSGKTTLAVNYALRLKQTFKQVTLCDLDIVNPYFRSADFIPVLNSKGVNVISSVYANSNAETTALPSGVQAAFDTPGGCAVVDLGGDGQGALALGRYSKKFQSESDYQMLLVVNPFRPLTRDAANLIDIKEEIESASGVKFTGIANNPNLGAETTGEDVISSLSVAEELSIKTGLPVAFTSVSRRFSNSSPDFFPMEIFKKPTWKVD